MSDLATRLRNLAPRFSSGATLLEAADELNRLAAQRDALLGACSKARTYITMARQGAGCQTEPWSKLIDEISAAIAQCEGGAA